MESSKVESLDERLKNAEIEARAQNISKNVRCLECGHQSIEESGANIAILMRKLIRDELRKGQSENEVYKKLSDEFGESVLYAPKFDMQTAALYLMPVACLGGAAAFLSYRQRRPLGNTKNLVNNLLHDVSLSQREKEAIERLLEPPMKGW